MPSNEKKLSLIDKHVYFYDLQCNGIIAYDT